MKRLINITRKSEDVLNTRNLIKNLDPRSRESVTRANTNTSHYNNE